MVDGLIRRVEDLQTHHDVLIISAEGDELRWRRVLTNAPKRQRGCDARNSHASVIGNSDSDEYLSPVHPKQDQPEHNQDGKPTQDRDERWAKDRERRGAKMADER
jgi:hypothetical protein